MGYIIATRHASHPVTRCPLCTGTATAFHEDQHGRFHRCPDCALVFRDAAQHLSTGAEVARYREHLNALDDQRYLDFLDRLAAPLAERLPLGARGLDFGCGPVPAMALLLERRGFPTASWDPHFHNHASLLDATYDFVACSEVLEHIPAPRPVLATFARLLQRGGLVGIMTQFRAESRSFESWWYRRDPTHVCLYCPHTMHWIARNMNWEMELLSLGVTIFRVPPSPD